jgi:hypothetical protein
MCLCAPPAVRLWLDFSAAPGRGAEPHPEPADARTAEAIARLRHVERDLKALDVTLPSDEYEPVPARVLARDPAPHRHGLLAGVRSGKPVPPDSTAITVDQRLLGRVIDVVGPPPASGGFAVAQVETILDRGFRVRFVAGETRGLAAGTGVTTPDGRAVLEIILFDGPRELEDGEVLLTDGSLGVFAPGIPIGSVSLESGAWIGERRSRLPVIRSEVIVERQRELILLRDSMRLSAARVTWRRS